MICSGQIWPVIYGLPIPDPGMMGEAMFEKTIENFPEY
jgi:hypothetical protein